MTGLITIETLQQTLTVLNDATQLFVESCGSAQVLEEVATGLPGQDPASKKVVTLADLTASKPTLRGKVANCKSVYRECAWDVSYSCLAPRDLKPITGKGLNRLMRNVVALVGACESKYALLGNSKGGEEEESAEKQLEESDGAATPLAGMRSKKDKVKEREEFLAAFKLKREIANADEQLLRYLLGRYVWLT